MLSPNIYTRLYGMPKNEKEVNYLIYFKLWTSLNLDWFGRGGGGEKQDPGSQDSNILKVWPTYLFNEWAPRSKSDNAC